MKPENNDDDFCLTFFTSKIDYVPWDSCTMNKGIVCIEHKNCDRCGWNPEVELQRKEMLKARVRRRWLNML